MNLDTQIVLWIIGLSIPVAVSLTMVWNWRDARDTRRRAEEDRITAPLPVMRDELTEPWPTRQTPSDLAAAYDWAAAADTQLNTQGDARAASAWGLGERSQPQPPEPLPPPHLPIRGRAYLPRRRIVATVGHLVVDENGCGVPCLAWHCALHGPPGTEAQRGGHAFTEAVRRALFTPTAEWDVRAVGVEMPDAVPEGVELIHIGMRELCEVAT